MKSPVCMVLACLASISSSAHSAENFLTARDRTEWTAGGFYDGRFEDGTRFQITLPYAAPVNVANDRELLRASYWYPRHYKGAPINLVTVERSGSTLTVASHHRDSARVDESFVVTLSADGKTGQGRWSSDALGKQLSFSLTRAVSYKAVVVTRPFKAPDDEAAAEPRQFEFSSVFPQLGDPKADAWIRGRAAGCESDLQCVRSITIAWKSAALISLEAYGWGYGYGAAHGNGGTHSQHYRLTPAGAEPVGLAAFLKPSKACHARVSGTIVAKLRAAKFSAAEYGALSDKYPPTFIATPTGIRFHFDPYHVGSYAEGATSVFVALQRGDACVVQLPQADQG